MCNIAGYVGEKRAAPILLEMIRRQQYYDGAAGTGIATIHEGRIYTAKVVGDVDTLIRETDAMNFPGTVGIIHSRPGGDEVEHMHPFLDFSGKLALVANGIFSTTDTPAHRAVTDRIMHGYFEAGLRPGSALPGDGSDRFSLPDGSRYHGTEVYALRTGELMDAGATLAEALCESLSERPNALVAVAIDVREPDRIAFGKLSFPMSVGLGDGETYIATTPFAFPEDAGIDRIVLPPECVITEVRAGEMSLTRHRVRNLRMEQVTADIYHRAYQYIEAYLTGAEACPKNLWDFEKMYATEWKDLWQEPHSDCVFFREDALFKPYPELTYSVLWALEKEGRLHKCLRLRGGRYPMYHFWVD